MSGGGEPPESERVYEWAICQREGCLPEYGEGLLLLGAPPPPGFNGVVSSTRGYLPRGYGDLQDFLKEATCFIARVKDPPPPRIEG